MNSINYITIAASLLLAIPYAVFAQDKIEQSVKATDLEQLDFYSQWGDVTLVYENREGIYLSIESTVNGQNVKDMLAIDLSEKGRTLSLSTTLDLSDLDKVYTVHRDDGTKIVMSEEEYRRQHTTQGKYSMIHHGHDIQIDITIRLPLHVKLTCESTYGHIILLSDDSLVKDHRIKILSTYGFVDLSLSAIVSSRISLKAPYGNIFTDHDLLLDSRSTSKNEYPFGQYVRGTMTSGDTGYIEIEASYDNIYFRKS